ncbi:MAG: cyanoexosortase A system-associated protein [Cyanosarcina radialis HA8281-LM2]|jgi:cyanosortase A-associated protein|nr:cyanoexosortase A system-associated protein [Cyanosarcina radialis HA8281-LM2]
MIRPPNLRLFLLAIAFSGTILVAGRAIIYPATAVNGVVRPADFAFPLEVPLLEWQPKPSSPLNSRVSPPPELLASRLYRYHRANLDLDIEMRYTIEKAGSVINFVRAYTTIPVSALSVESRRDRYQTSVGFYTLFVHQKRAYLSSCINPLGSSTVLSPQFHRNRYTYDVKFERVVKWLFSRENIRDFRCLWTQLSIPVNSISAEDDYAILEKAWFSWYQWWQPRFPQP